MCGIAGIVGAAPGRGPVRESDLLAMSRALRHRGPDEEGHLLSAQAGLAIQRLKVIDLETGSQPIFNETGEIAVVFNGEIYNYRELRVELEAKGHRFKTNGDTETIVHLYEEEGDDFLKRLNGMFGLALWDNTRSRLILARDRTGIKPLFYAELDGRLLFGSEIKALLAFPGFPRRMDWEGLGRYLSFYYVSAPKSLFAGISRLPPGHRLICQDGGIRIEPYWDGTPVPEEGRSLSHWAGEFRETLGASVRRHLQSDVPVGLYLSGGLDSTSIAAEAALLQPGIRTYSVGYREESFSELEQAQLVARRFKTEHEEFVLEAGIVPELLPRVIAALDEPHGDWTHLPTYFLSERAKAHSTVVLTGSGGDELFGGYPTLLAAKAARLYRMIPEAMRRGLIEPMVEALPSSYERMSWDFMLKSFVRGAGLPCERAHHRFKEIFSAEQRSELLMGGAAAKASREDPFSVFERHLEGTAGMHWMDRLMRLDLKVFLVDNTLYVQDMMTAAHSLEGRMPLLDSEMIDFSYRVPWKFKAPGWTTKHLMRESMRGVLPPEIVSMKKKGFLVPGSFWLRDELRPFVEKTVAAARERLGGVVNFKTVERLCAEHFSGRRDHTRRIQCLLSWFVWDGIFQPALD